MDTALGSDSSTGGASRHHLQRHFQPLLPCDPQTQITRETGQHQSKLPALQNALRFGALVMSAAGRNPLKIPGTGTTGHQEQPRCFGRAGCLRQAAPAAGLGNCHPPGGAAHNKRSGTNYTKGLAHSAAIQNPKRHHISLKYLTFGGITPLQTHLDNSPPPSKEGRSIFADKHAHAPWIFSAPRDSSLARSGPLGMR